MSSLEVGLFNVTWDCDWTDSIVYKYVCTQNFENKDYLTHYNNG